MVARARRSISRSAAAPTLGDAQARRLRIRVKGEDGSSILPTRSTTPVVAPPRMLIAFLENNLQAGRLRAHSRTLLRPYMGGKEVITPAK